jgi:Conserved hypothetical protein 2217 (DUF2460)
MATFPALKTGAVAQYPAVRASQFRNQILRFVDGNEQRYRDSAGPLHRWTIQLDYLDSTEMAAIEDFFLNNQGSFANFSFTDPWDNTVYPNCSIVGDNLAGLTRQEFQNTASVTILENRS